MKIIKSVADCFSCELYGNKSCIMEVGKNVKYMEDVDIVFIAENPGKNECESVPPVPLIGLAGQLFRKYFKLYGLDKEKYLITNTVLCQTLNQDGTTGNPPDKVIDICKENAFSIIRECKPKLIVLLGASAGKAFGIIKKGSGITNMRGKVYKWEGFDVMLTFHPSYIRRNRGEESIFEKDMKSVYEFLTGNIINNTTVDTDISYHQSSDKMFYYKIPDKFYTKKYNLIDIQYLYRTSEVLYIFRDENGNKVYHKEKDNYICYQCPPHIKPELTMNMKDLIEIAVPYKKKYDLDQSITYNGDLRITTRHVQDFYLQNGNDEEYTPDIMFMDIEVYSETGDNSNVEEARDPIVIIGYIYKQVTRSYVYFPNEELRNKYIEKLENVIECKSEEELIKNYIRDFRQLDPFFICGWYWEGYDAPYLINRCKKLGIKYEELSKFGEVECKQLPKMNVAIIAGCVVLDQLWLYKTFTSSKKESYSLDFVANDELGEGKLGKGSDFSSMFFDDPAQAIKYNTQDVELLSKLNDKLGHVSFQIMRARLCKTSFESAKGSMGLIDSLLTYSLKERGIVCKNSASSDEDVEFEGAFVLEPMTGLHRFIVDFDFAALYPSIIMTYNIGINTFVMKFEDQSLGYIYAYDRENLPEDMVIIEDPLTTATKRLIRKDDLLKIIDDKKYICTINGCFFKSHSEERSYYLDMLESLLGMRKKYKKEMFEAAARKELKAAEVLDEKQLALKSLTNSVYGVFGTRYFRFFNIDLAKSITYSGQEVAKNSIIEVENVVTGIKNNIVNRPHKLTNKEMFGKLDREILNIITGDTDSMFVTYQNILGKKKYKDVVNDIERMNTDIENFLNTTVVGELIDRHNVERRNNRLEIKNELIIKNGLFLSKKHYTVYVLMREHKAVNEIKNVGIEIRRSDYPAFTKKKLMELIDLILKTDDKTIIDILDYVKNTEDDFINMINSGDKSIARPVSFTKKEADYKKITFGVNGMKNWNILEKKVFDQGSRGYHFKIKGIDIDKAPERVLESYYRNFVDKGKILKDIVIPETEPGLPDYYIKDTPDMLRFSWVDRYSLLLEPLLKIENSKKYIGF